MSRNQRPVIEYPCSWEYTVIGTDHTQLKEAVQLVCAPSDVVITVSHTSSKGKYLSVKARLLVESEEHRNSIFTMLKDHTAIHFVL